MTYKILITDELSPQGIAQLEAAEDVEFDVVTGLTPATLAQRIAGYDGLIVRSSVKVTAEVLEAADSLKVVGRAGVGVDNIDLDMASTRGIIVMNTPGANTIATAEHTMAMLLALCRHVPQAYTSLKQGEWNRKQFMGRQLYRKIIGIIGMGRIGARVALRCQAFGMDILAFDPFLSPEVARELKIKPVEFGELLSRSDFIALHAALTPSTENMINAEAIAKMKQGVRLINTARGALVDEDALVEGLRSGKIAGVALDVFKDEPLGPDNPLRHMQNVVMTPHIAASTEEAQRDVSTQIVTQLIDALRGVEFRNAINLPVADAELLRTLNPFLSLAEKVGSLQAQLAGDVVNRVEVEVKGDEISDHIKPITVAILKGLLKPILHQTVNYINAPHLAQKRGIVISQASGLPTPDHANLISCRVECGTYSRTLSATLFSHGEPRLVQMDGYRLDTHPQGIILVMESQDVPGVVGSVGTLLGKHHINIAEWRMGRIPAQTSGASPINISFINLDAPAPPETLADIRQLDKVFNVTQVEL